MCKTLWSVCAQHKLQLVRGECEYKLSMVCDYENTITVHDYVIQSKIIQLESSTGLKVIQLD